MNKNSLKETYASHKTGKLQMNVYETDNDIPYHWHDEYEFIYVTNGECECIINGQSIEIIKGQAILINAGELHTVNLKTSGQFFALVFHPYMIFGTEFNEFFSKKISYKRIYCEENKNEKVILNLLRKIHSAFHNRYYGFELTLKALITEIFGVIYSENLYRINEKNEISAPDSFTHIVEYIHSHFDEKISLDHIAEYSNFSKSYLIRLFRKNTGKTFSAYLNSFRIYKACEMLDSTQKNILEISANCGFENVAYFIKIFKRIIGTTPYKYRTR
jgi:AraC-like DNA-binding protein